MARNADDTVIIRRPGPPRARRTPYTLIAVAVVVLAAAGGGLFWWQRAPAPPAVAIIPSTTEAAVGAESVATRTVFRFAPNPAILIVDFPTLAEQGQMLNRMAAWAERSGVPHDRLLNDADLAAAIKAGGDTPETYYYGHDYRGSDLVNFFALADRDHVALTPAEQQLRALMAQAKAEPFGLGAIITVPRADTANGVDAAARATILHHELSHGEYFTNPVYARFVGTIWQSVLTPSERAAFRTYLASEGYDPALEDLMANEMQAYLMHTPDPKFFDPGQIGIPVPRLNQIRASFLASMPSCWLRDVTTDKPFPLPKTAQQAAAPVTTPRRKRRQGAGRVSSTTAAAARLPPCRRRSAIADFSAAR